MGYFHNPTGRLGKIQIELDWKMIDFCRMQQIIHSHISANEDSIDNLIEKHGEKLNNPTEENMGFIHLRENINAQSASNFQTHQFTNQMTVVGLWAIAEQTMGFVYKEMYSSLCVNLSLDSPVVG